jgi:lysozyme
MQASESAFALIRRFEGCRLTAYVCPAGKLTIGYGHAGTDVRPGQSITAGQAEELLRADIAPIEQTIAECVTAPLTQDQFDALVVFAFNVGIGALRRSTLVKRINAKDPNASHEFDRWTMANGRVLPGLIARRAAERGLFEGVLQL